MRQKSRNCGDVGFGPVPNLYSSFVISPTHYWMLFNLYFHAHSFIPMGMSLVASIVRSNFDLGIFCLFATNYPLEVPIVC